MGKITKTTLTELTDKELMWAEAYLRHFNKTQATFDAGYAVTTTASAASMGHEVSNREKIQAYIKRRITETAMGADEVLMLLAAQGRGDVGDYLTQTAEGDIVIDLPRALKAKTTRLIKKLTQKRTVRTRGDDETTEEVLTSIEMYDAQGALQLIGRHHGIFVDRTEHTGKDGEPIEVNVTESLRSRIDSVAARLRAGGVPTPDSTDAGG